MSSGYQSSTNGRRPPVQESYGGGEESSSNVGLPNSARGEGTTASEMAFKLRFLNCAVCTYLLFFHVLPLAMNPIRLALLLKSPVRLVLEAVVGIVAVSMLITEAQVPVLAEKILVLFQKCRVGNVQLIDLDVARGRVVVVAVMTMAIGMMNHMNSHYSSSSGHIIDNNTAEPTAAVVDDVVNEMNSTAAINETMVNETMADIDNITIASQPVSTYNSSDDHNAIIGFILAIISSTIFSLSMWILLSLLIYSLYVIREYPSYAEYRAFPHVQDDSSSSGVTRPLSSATASATASARSWVSNIPDFSNITGGGYQSVDNPTQMNV